MYRFIRRWWEWHKAFLGNNRGNIVKMLTPPKSKSPWEAMTTGSTGGWAAGLKNWGPVANAALGMVPIVGPALAIGGGMAGMAGGGTGFQGTDKGWSNLGSTALGGLAGYGLGSIGAGVGGALAGGAKSGLTGLGSGFMSGAGNYANTAIIPGVSGSSGTNMFHAVWDPISKTFAPAGGGGGGGGMTFSSIPPGGAGGFSAAPLANNAIGAGMAAGAGGLTALQGLGAALAGGSAIASLTQKPPTMDYLSSAERVGQSQDLLRKYMGDAAMQLPNAASEEYLKQIKAPIGELYPGELENQWSRLNTMINKSWDNYDKAIDAQYAQSGGVGSTDYNNAKANSRQLRTQELSQSFGELQNKIFQQQVQIKQQALQSAAQQGNFDFTIAMELAKMSGQDQQLQAAIETGNYDQFQNLMSQLMFQGFQMANPQPLKMPGVGNISLSLMGGR